MTTDEAAAKLKAFQASYVPEPVDEQCVAMWWLCAEDSAHWIGVDLRADLTDADVRFHKKGHNDFSYSVKHFSSVRVS